jgi:hydrophobic/amphiphilic exporter-1 (mainly G- bacteria), HAE1 family
VLRHRYITLGATLAAFLSSFALVPLVGVEFQPAVDTGEFRVRLETPQGSSLDYTTAKVQQAEDIIRAFPEVERTYATVNGGSNSSSTSATINVLLVDEEERDVTSQEMTRTVRQALQVIPGISPSLGAANGFGAFSDPIEVTISGDSFDVLERLAADLTTSRGRIEGVTDISTSLEETQPTIAVRLNRDAADDFGVNLQEVGGALSTLLGGTNVGEWTSTEGLSYQLNVQLPEGVRSDVDALGALPIATGDGSGLIRLDQVARFEPSTGAISIQRQDAARTVEVTANLSGRALGDAQAEIDAATAALELPVGYRILQGGEAEQLAEAGGSALTALVLAITFIYLVLASQFGSFLQPLAIMMSLPLSIMGVLAGLIVGGSTLNMYSVIGFIMLMGLVVKNAILLVDNANQHMREGQNLYDALVEAGQTRFRPIVMTTLAMIFGMLPLALNLHGGSGQNAPMAHAVIGGLISSTLLTLVVVPVVLTFLDAFGRRVARFFPAPPDHAVEHEAAEPALATPALRTAAE